MTVAKSDYRCGARDNSHRGEDTLLFNSGPELISV